MNHGGSASQPFVTLAEWTERLDGLLEQELVYPTPNYDREPDRGIVRVKFNCSESGRPDKVTILKSSGHASLDRAAIRAVSRLASLHPLPTGFKPDQKYEAILVFASSSTDPALRTSMQEQVRRNGWYVDPTVAQRMDRSGTEIASRR